MALAALVLAAVLTQRAGDRSLYPPTSGQPGVTVYVSYNFFHSDLLVPKRFLLDGAGPSARAASQIAARDWIALGWGDANFYQGHGFGPGRALALLRSAFWPRNPSVVRLGADDPQEAAPGWRLLKLSLSTAGAEQLRRRLDASFAAQPSDIAQGPEPRGSSPPPLRFFPSRENAWALHVCNQWTAELLSAAGVPTTPVLDLMTAGLAADLRWRGRAQPVSP